MPWNLVLLAAAVTLAACGGGSGGSSGGGSGSSGGGSSSSGGGSSSSGGGSASSGGGSSSSGGGSSSSGGGSSSSGGGSASSGGGSASDDPDAGFAEVDVVGSAVLDGHFTFWPDAGLAVQRSVQGARFAFGSWQGTDGNAYRSKRLLFTIRPDAGTSSCGSSTIPAITLQDARTSFVADAGASRLDQYGTYPDGGCTITVSEIDLSDGGYARGTFSAAMSLDVSTVANDGGLRVQLQNGKFLIRW